MCGKGMRLGILVGGGFAPLRDGIIDAFVEGHNPADRADREGGPGQETPEAELASVRLAFGEMRDLHHDGKPPLPRRRRPRLVVDEPGHVCLCDAGQPQIHGGP